MCRTTRLVMTAVACLMALTVPAFGQLGLGVVPNMGASVNVGATNVPGTVQVTNVSALSVNLTGVFLQPSCKVVPVPGTPCPAGQEDLGVFTINAGAVGAALTACAGISFAVAGPSASGEFQFTPASTVTLAPNATCTINFTYNAIKLPTADAVPATPTTVQTVQVARAAGIETGGVLTAGGVGTSMITVPFTCAVQVDKQVSCDGGTTWTDQGLTSNNSDGTNGCIGRVGQNIQVRYRARNTGTVAATCTLGDSNLTVLPSAIANIQMSANSAETPVGTTFTGLCQTARAGGEPNTATLNCTCAVPLQTPPTATATDIARFECCGVEIDKQVSCSGGPFTDVGFGTNNPSGTQSCNGINGQPVAIQYFIRNVGSIAASCNLTDIQSGGATIFTAPPGTYNLAAGATTPVISNTQVTQCSTALDANEPDTATTNCACAATGLVSNTASANDTAEINCGNPSFTINKQCIPVATAAGTFNVRIDITNNGTLPLTCTVTDSYIAGPACPATGTAVPVTGLTPANPVSVPVTPTPTTVTGQLTALQTTVCNTATASCTTPGLAAPIVHSSSALCPVGQGCFTRTPGYWCTHPTQTQQVIGAGLPVCGITLTTATAGVPNSATEDLGSHGKDAKDVGTSPQQLQLLRQCTAAALNLRVSADPRSQLNCATALPGITNLFNRCCVGTALVPAICNRGATAQQIDASGCIEGLDAFNNMFDEIDFPSWLQNSSADPDQCQEANGNGFVNPGRKLGPR